MTTETGADAFRSAPERSSLAEVAGAGVDVLRPCLFSFVGKIGTPVNDLLVPLVTEAALDDLLDRTGIAGVVTQADLADRVPETLGLAVADDPMRAHHEIHLALANMPGRLWRDFASEVDPSARVHPAACIASYNVRIGPGAVVMAHATVNERSLIGEGTRIHSQAVIGADAYEIVMIEGRQILRPQTGGVAIGRRCEIMAGTVVTRSAFCGATTIGDHCVLDCNTTIAHDCQIDADVRVGGSSWIGGRVTIGARAVLGPNCTIGNALAVGSGARVSLGSVVTRDVPAGSHVSGNFAIDHVRMIENVRRIR